jgi:bacillithiol system protein YtxJ
MSTYTEITTLEEWEAVKEEAEDGMVFIFKHSTTCPVSADAYRQFDSYLNTEAEQSIQYVLVKVIESRPVSNQMAADLNVKHESPQAILIKNRTAVWHTSHFNITKKAITEALKSAMV